MSVVVAAAASVDLSSFHLSPSSSSFYLRHSCLVCIFSSHLRYLASIETLGSLQTCDILMYGCKLTKFSALPFNQSIYVSSFPFDLIHSDVWGHYPVAIKEGSQYYVFFFIIIDDHTCYCWVYLMKHHSKFFEIYTTFQTLVKNQHSIVIKCFRCDLGRKYTFNKFCELFALDKIIHKISCTDTPEQNKVVERKHRHIIEIACSFLLSAFVPSKFWGKVVLTAISLINTISSSHISGFSSFEKLHGYAPEYSSFRAFGVLILFFILM